MSQQKAKNKEMTPTLPQEDIEQSWTLGAERLGGTHCYPASYIATVSLQQVK